MSRNKPRVGLVGLDIVDAPIFWYASTGTGRPFPRAVARIIGTGRHWRIAAAAWDRVALTTTIVGIRTRTVWPCWNHRGARLVRSRVTRTVCCLGSPLRAFFADKNQATCRILWQWRTPIQTWHKIWLAWQWVTAIQEVERFNFFPCGARELLRKAALTGHCSRPDGVITSLSQLRHFELLISISGQGRGVKGSRSLGVGTFSKLVPPTHQWSLYQPSSPRLISVFTDWPQIINTEAMLSAVTEASNRALKSSACV